MGLFNIAVKRVGNEIDSIFHSETYDEAKRAEAILVHWLPNGIGVAASVVMPDASTVEGLAEDENCRLQPGDIVQFERFGFVRIDTVDRGLVAYYAHR